MGVGCREDVASITCFFFASPTCLPRPSFVCRVPGGDYDGLPLLARPRAWLGDLHSLTMGVAAIRCGKAPDAVSAFSHAMAVSRPTVPVSCSGCGCLAADTPPPISLFPCACPCQDYEAHYGTRHTRAVIECLVSTGAVVWRLTCVDDYDPSNLSAKVRSWRCSALVCCRVDPSPPFLPPLHFPFAAADAS